MEQHPEHIFHFIFQWCQERDPSKQCQCRERFLSQQMQRWGDAFCDLNHIDDDDSYDGELQVTDCVLVLVLLALSNRELKIDLIRLRWRKSFSGGKKIISDEGDVNNCRLESGGWIIRKTFVYVRTSKKHCGTTLWWSNITESRDDDEWFISDQTMSGDIPSLYNSSQ